MERASDRAVLQGVMSWWRVWVTAVTRPGLATFTRVSSQGAGRTRDTWLWLWGSALLSGLVVSLGPRAGRPAPAFDAGLALAIAAFTVIAVLVWAGFTGCAHGLATLMGGRGIYRTFLYLAAAFNAPLVLVAALLALVPWSGPRVGLVIYWLVLHVVAVRAVYHLSGLRASAAVLLSLTALGGCVVGAGMLTLLLAL